MTESTIASEAARMNIAARVRSPLAIHVCNRISAKVRIAGSADARHNAAFDRSFHVTRFVIAASSIRSIEFNKLDRRFHV